MYLKLWEFLSDIKSAFFLIQILEVESKRVRFSRIALNAELSEVL